MIRLIQESDRFFVAGARGMAGSAICRPYVARAMEMPPKVEPCSRQSAGPGLT